MRCPANVIPPERCLLTAAGPALGHCFNAMHLTGDYVWGLSHACTPLAVCVQDVCPVRASSTPRQGPFLLSLVNLRFPLTLDSTLI